MPCAMPGTNLNRSRLRYHDGNNHTYLPLNLVGASLLAMMAAPPEML
jgi:hypothetical protein